MGRRRHPIAAIGSIAVLVLLAGAPSARAAVPTPQWDHDPELSTADGYVQLRWTVDAEEMAYRYHLQEGREAVFADTEAQYQGPQLASFVSGLENGTYYFRVRAQDVASGELGDWSETVTVQVDHHDTGFALGLMALGGFVFLATAGFLWWHRNDPVSEEPA